MKGRLLFLFLFLLATVKGTAQQPTPPLHKAPAHQTAPHIRFEHLTDADGLPENSVTDMLQDHLGFMWLGTQNGLVRYDGTHMTVFQNDPTKPYSLKGRQIRALHEDRNGDIWIGCESLFRFERATERFIEYPRKALGKTSQLDNIEFIWADKQGAIWTITAHNNFQSFLLDRYNPKTDTWTYFRHDPNQSVGLASNNIYVGKQKIPFHYSFAEDNSGKIWVVTQGEDGNTLHWLDTKTDQFMRFKPASTLAGAFKKIGIISLANQQVYLSSFQNGLFRITPQTGQLEHFVHESGNAHSLRCDSVASVHQSRDGLLWVATARGMDRLDPQTGVFTHLVSKPDDPTTLSPGLLDFLHELPNGDMWFMTPNGLNFYHRQSHQFVRYGSEALQADALHGNTLFSFLVDKTGLVWVGTWGDGLNKQSRLTHIPLLTYAPQNTNSLQSANVYCVYEAPSEPGIIWFGSDKGLDRLNKKTGQYTHYWHNDVKTGSIGKGPVTAIAEDKKGRFWIGTDSDGLYLMNRNTGQFTRFMPNLKRNPNESQFEHVIRLVPAADGTLWLSNFYELDHLDVDHNQYTYYYQADSTYSTKLFTRLTEITVPQRRLAAILHPQGRLNKTARFTLAKSTDVCLVMGGSLSFDSKWDNGWLEDDAGRVIWEMNFDNSKPDNYADQRVAVKTISLPAGNYRLRYESVGRFYYGHWPQSPPIHADLWGIQLLTISHDENQTLSQLITQKYWRPGLSDDAIFTLRTDANGKAWTGSNFGGVEELNPVTNRIKTYFNYVNGPVTVNTLLEDRQAGGFWVGDYVSGLLFLDKHGKVTRRFNAASGLPGNTVRSIERDAKGYLWLGTHNGLCRFDPKTEHFRWFNLSHGLQSLRFDRDASCRDSEGLLYFSGEKGVNVINPNELIEDSVPPPVVLTDLVIGSHSTTLGPNGQLPIHISAIQQITLPHDQNDLTFHFAALSYSRGLESQYAYQLSPTDQDWVSGGTTQQARYSDLSPGQYTFRVKAANADGVWNKTGISISLTILPPWWRTWWAYLIYALIFGGLLRAYIVYRSRALRRENRMLEEKVARRTNQVQQQKEEIETQRDYLEETLTDLKKTQDQLIQKEKLASLGELTAGIAHEIQNPLNFVNNFSEVSTELVDELKAEVLAGRTDDILAIADGLAQNLQRIAQHGNRASRIVKGMLEHSHAKTGDRRPTDLNALVDEYMRLAYQGQRVKDKSFNCVLVTKFDLIVIQVKLVPQEIGRVLLNLFNNAFYAVREQQQQTDSSYQPTITVTTKKTKDGIQIRVADNGTGMRDSVQQKIFQPFFTTKPTGEGTGLGLSLSYDIITKGHGGTLNVTSQEGQGTEFTVFLPSA